VDALGLPEPRNNNNLLQQGPAPHYAGAKPITDLSHPGADRVRVQS
jgi:hypothetical protein